MPNYQVILNAAGWHEKKILTEDDLCEIDLAIEALHPVEDEVIIEDIEPIEGEDVVYDDTETTESEDVEEGDTETEKEYCDVDKLIGKTVETEDGIE